MLPLAEMVPRLLAEFVVASAAEIYDLSRPPELLEAVALMEKFADTPMDFADSTLVLLAEALNVHEILTLDRRGFSSYEPGGAGICSWSSTCLKDLPPLVHLFRRRSRPAPRGT